MFRCVALAVWATTLLFISNRVLAAQSPYLGAPVSLPGVVEAEDFDNGGQGLAYNDTTPGNQGGQYRNTDVDILAGGRASSGSQFCVGHVQAGEWLEYTVNITSPGSYRVDVEVSSATAGGVFHLSIDGSNKTGALSLHNTGGWGNWTAISKSGIALAGGTHVLRLTIDSANANGQDIGNFDCFQFTKTGSGSSDGGFHPNPLSWQQKATNPVHREEAQSLVYKGRLYELGGFDNDFNAMTRVDAYDPNSNRWTRLHDLPYPITHAAVAADPDGHSFWFVGGFQGSFTHNPPVSPDATSKVYKYDAATDSWSQGPLLPSEHGSGAGVVNGKLYFFSGTNKDHTKDLDDVYVLDLSHQSNGWSRIGSFPNPRNHIGAIVVAGKIYAVGGQHHTQEQSVMQNEVDRFDPATGKWTRVTSLPTSLSHFTAATVLYNRYIITVGGENPHNVASAFIFAYDTVLDKWAPLSSLPDPRRAGAAGVIGDLLIQSGGYERSAAETSTTYTADLSKVFT